MIKFSCKGCGESFEVPGFMSTERLCSGRLCSGCYEFIRRYQDYPLSTFIVSPLRTLMFSTKTSFLLNNTYYK